MVTLPFKKLLLVGSVKVLLIKWMQRSDKMLSLPQGFVGYHLVQRENRRGQLRVQLPRNYFGAEGDADPVQCRLLGTAAARPTERGPRLQNTV